MTAPFLWGLHVSDATSARSQRLKWQAGYGAETWPSSQKLRLGAEHGWSINVAGHRGPHSSLPILRTHFYLPRRKGLAPGAGAGPSTGPEEEAEGAGWSCWGRGQACAAGTLEGPKEQQENRIEGGKICGNVQKGVSVLSFTLKTSSNWSPAAPPPSIYNLMLQNRCILYISLIIKQSTIKMQHLKINSIFAQYYRTSRIF